MNWLVDLITDTDSMAHIALLYAVVITFGLLLGKIRIFGVSLGVTFVLFSGILLGHFGFTGNAAIMNFMQDFGLILFVFCIGLQVGPSFFASLRKEGVEHNVVAVGIVLLNIAVALGLFFLLRHTRAAVSLPMLVGVLCGAVTNTPGLGAAQDALTQTFAGGETPQIALGYACAYPLGVLGIILGIILIRYFFRIKVSDESRRLQELAEADAHQKPHMMHLQVDNKALDGKTLLQIKEFLARDFVISRILHDGHVSIPNRDTVFRVGDQLFCVCADADAEAISAFIGPVIKVDWQKQDRPLVSRRVLITRPGVNGRTLGQMHFSSIYGVNVTRISRAGMYLFAHSHLRLQVGDRVIVVGPEDAVDRVAAYLGDAQKELDRPNILTMFVGILLGILLGSLPIAFPGMPTPLKLGLAGGPLIVALLISKFGYALHLVTYSTTSANLMMRETGLAIFLASVGIRAGADLAETLMHGGLNYVWIGFLITIIPILVMGAFARLHYKMNYLTLMGLIAGANTDPPALAYASQTAGNDAPAIGYSTVYPLTMFLRILTAQLLILLFA
ncbi:MAG: putative transporter [Bacteroidales bacterium]|nr:putative transporter [Bacteroidales bacterium]